MEIKHLSSLPIAIAKMKIGSIEPDEGAQRLVQNEERSFGLTAKRSITDKLSIGETIEFVFVPSESLQWDKAVLFLSKGTGVRREILIGKNTYWHHYYADRWAETR